MKKTYQSITLLILISFMASVSNAIDIQHVGSPSTPDKNTATGIKHAMKQGMGIKHGVGGMMANMTEEERDQHMRGMQEHMLKMHDLSNRILAEQDPTKKEQLKTEQFNLMKEHHAQHHAKIMQFHKQMQESGTK